MTILILSCVITTAHARKNHCAQSGQLEFSCQNGHVSQKELAKIRRASLAAVANVQRALEISPEQMGEIEFIVYGKSKPSDYSHMDEHGVIHLHVLSFLPGTDHTFSQIGRAHV